MQNERHRADYDTSFLYQREQVEEILVMAEEAFRLWVGVRFTDEDNICYAALLLGTRWAK